MKTFRELLGKPSAAVRAMVNGLRRQSERKDFVVDMDEYGYVEDGICFGCAATCATQEATGMQLDSLSIEGESSRAERYGIAVIDLWKFEVAIDLLRRGYVADLTVYFDAEMPKPAVPLVGLSADDWQQDLPAYEAYAEQLEAAGL